jgi:hypothetical protein
MIEYKIEDLIKWLEILKSQWNDSKNATIDNRIKDLKELLK